MKTVGILLTNVALFSLVFLAGNPLFAFDGNTAKSDTEKVKNKLLDNGLSSDYTSKKVTTMSEDDLAYFASHPERLQVAGSGLTTEETVIAVLFLTAGIITVAMMAQSNGF